MNTQLQKIAEGHVLFTKAADGWMIVGPTATMVTGNMVTVTKANGTTKTVFVGETGPARTRDGVDYTVATIEHTTVVGQATPAQAPCPHGDRDNNGRCYACGQYNARYNVGPLFG